LSLEGGAWNVIGSIRNLVDCVGQRSGREHQEPPLAYVTYLTSHDTREIGSGAISTFIVQRVPKNRDFNIH
jgi:hypothetical protein